MRLGFDIDGVLANIEEPLEEILTAHFGSSPLKNRKNRFYMHERYDVSAQEMDQIIIGIFNDPGFWESAKPIKENVLAAREAKHCGHDIVWITGRQNVSRVATLNWANDWFIPCDELLMDCKQEKHRAMRYTGCDLLIEDRYEEAAVVAQKGFRSYLLRRTYNIEQEAYDTSGAIWVNNVNEVLEIEGIVD